MKRVLFVALTLLLASSAAMAQQDYGLPELHTIRTATLSPSYSCRSPEDFSKGYESTALFLSNQSKRRNSPDLLFNGACRGEDSFESSTAGDDMAFVVDLGSDIQLETLTTSEIFNIYYRRSLPTPPDSRQIESVLRRSVKVVPDHTYAVFLNKSSIRGLFVFKVTNHLPHKSVDIQYAVKEYQVIDVKAQSPGFSWEQQNTTALADSSASKEPSRKQN